MVLLIVYGSLYPWTFVPRHVAGGPVWYLLHQWDFWSNGYLIRDVFVNLAIYLPVGFCGVRAFPERPGWFRLILFGFALSASMELAQVYVPTRQSSMVDLICNTAGTGAGIAIAKLAARVGKRPADWGAAFLATGWLACILFPLLPLFSAFTIYQTRILFVHSPVVSQAPAIPALAFWYAAGLLLTAAGVPWARLWLTLSLAAIPAQIHIIERVPLEWEAAGAVAGLILFALRPRLAPVRRAEGWSFLALVVLGSLWPFHFAGPPNRFWVVPFEDLIKTDGPTAIWIILSQIVAWGTAIWLLGKSGERFWRAVALVTTAVAAAQLTTMYIPLARPNITAPLLALIAGYLLNSVKAGGSRMAASPPPPR